MLHSHYFCRIITAVFVDTRLSKRKPRGNVSKISVNHACYRGQKVTLVAVIGGFRSDLSITCMIDGNFGNVSAGVLFSKVAYQRKRW